MLLRKLEPPRRCFVPASVLIREEMESTPCGHLRSVAAATDFCESNLWWCNRLQRQLDHRHTSSVFSNKKQPCWAKLSFLLFYDVSLFSAPNYLVSAANWTIAGILGGKLFLCHWSGPLFAVWMELSYLDCDLTPWENFCVANLIGVSVWLPTVSTCWVSIWFWSKCLV